MSYDFNGNTIETDANGFLKNTEDWSKELAEFIAQNEGITLTPKHWDISSICAIVTSIITASSPIPARS